MYKICHVTSAHPPEDGRIFRRACVSSALAGYDTYLVERGDSYDKQGVHIIGIGNPQKTGRLYRMTVFARKAYIVASHLDADIYQLHDVELLPYAIKLKRQGKIVIFDSHENYTEQIRNKAYLPKPLLKIAAGIFDKYSKYVYSRIDALTYPGTGEPSSVFDGLCKRVVPTDNLPWLNELYDKFDPNNVKEKRSVCYIGGLEEQRGITQIVKAAHMAKCKLYLAGPFYTDEYRKELEQMPEYSCVEYLGILGRDDIATLLNKVCIGLCMLLDVGQYYQMRNLPTKVYEYMSMGIPVVLNDSPYNKEFLKKTKIGIASNPLKVSETSEAICTLLSNDTLREECSQNGRKAIHDRYCWDQGQEKLLNIYKELLNQ